MWARIEKGRDGWSYPVQTFSRGEGIIGIERYREREREKQEIRDIHRVLGQWHLLMKVEPVWFYAF